MHSEATPKRVDSVAPVPVAELLACPGDAGSLLTAAAQSIGFSPGEEVFRQGDLCRGLYLVVSGQLIRRAERMRIHVTLGSARPGDLVELAAALGDRRHTYSLIAQSSGSVLLLPADALEQVFQSYPPMRMRLLEELAREVSRGYRSCVLALQVRRRRSPAKSPIH